MQRRLLWAPVAALSVALTGCDFEDFQGDSHRFKEDFSYTYPLKPNGRIDLENFNGGIDILGWDKDSVEITGRKYARTPELLQAIKIDIVAAPDALRIRTIRPLERRGNMGANYVLRVPRRVVLGSITSSNGGIRLRTIDGEARLRSSNGAIEVFGLKGNLEANTSNAGIDVQGLEGSASLRTSNGGITVDRVQGAFEAFTSNANVEARLSGIDSSRPIRVETSNGNVDLRLDRMDTHQVRASSSNGSITVRLPADAQAQVRASTSNSSITTDFDVMVRGGTKSKSRLEGTIGSGGGMLDLGTSNGGIRLLKL